MTKLNERLLQKQSDSSEIVEREESLGRRVWVESKKMWVVAGAAIFARFSTFAIGIITQAFIGHLGSIELAGYAIVTTVIIRFALGVLLGMASALETLCGQAYGAKQYSMLGIHLQRSWIILFISATIILPIYIFISPILIALGQEESIANASIPISLWSIGIHYSFVFFFTMQMFLQAQSRNSIIAKLSALSLIVQLILLWIFRVKLNFGVNGIMGSTIVAYWVPIIGTLLYIMFKCPETWTGFSSSAFRGLWPIVKLSLTSGAMLCLEAWYYTLLILLTGNMKGAEISLDALSICLNINGWGMMIALGFFSAASVRVSNELGRGNTRAVKFAILVSVLTSLAIGVIFFFLFLFLRKRLAYIFSSDPLVAEAVDDLSPLLAISMLLNSVQPVLSGVAIGAGWQGIVAYVNIATYYIIGVPIGVVIGIYFGLEVKGIWIGMLFGTLVQTIVLIIITYKTNWDKQVENARTSVKKWSNVENVEPNRVE